MGLALWPLVLLARSSHHPYETMSACQLYLAAAALNTYLRRACFLAGSPGIVTDINLAHPPLIFSDSIKKSLLA